jgi:hypothetical protein
MFAQGADTGSDHHLVVAAFWMKITANKKKRDVMRKRLNVKKLENAQLKQCKMKLRDRVEALNRSDDEATEETCNKIKDIFLKTAENILGFR